MWLLSIACGARIFIDIARPISINMARLMSMKLYLVSVYLAGTSFVL